VIDAPAVGDRGDQVEAEAAHALGGAPQHGAVAARVADLDPDLAGEDPGGQPDGPVHRILHVHAAVGHQL